MKTNANYKILAMVPVFGFALNSCKQNSCYHKNVVDTIYDECLFTTDIETKESHIIEIKKAHGECVKIIQPGDTINVSARHYDNVIFIRGRIHVELDKKLAQKQK